MLYEFLETHRHELLARCRAAAFCREAPAETMGRLQDGIPRFLAQLILTLREEYVARSTGLLRDPFDEGRTMQAIASDALLHGRELSAQGYPVDHAVRDYGDLCQAITGLAFESGIAIEVEEFRTVNRCLDDGIADAVNGYALRHASVISAEQLQSFNQRLGFLAHELRNQLQIALLAIDAMRKGKVGLQGSTGALLDRSLMTMNDLIDQSLADVRIIAGMPPRDQLFPVGEFVAELQVAALLQSAHRRCTFAVTMPEAPVGIFADRELLRSAIGNLLQNAFKFTAFGTEVSLHVYLAGPRVIFDIADHCGGLPPLISGTLFAPFAQAGRDTSGLGLGLSIARRIVEASAGELRVRDVPGHGCVFTVDLPQQSL